MSSDVSKRLEGKIAIITGGASGIGATAVHLFHANGAKVVIADIQDSLGEAIANKLGENVTYIHCDVSDEDHVINLVDSTVAKYGKLDIMYNNAGVLDRALGSILDTTQAEIQRLLNVNVVGSFLGAKHAARVMIPQKKGCILFTASASASVAGLATHAYTASKSGVLGLANNLALELGQHGVRVNCISPYGLATGMTNETTEIIEHVMNKSGNLKGATLRSNDVASAALYLGSDEASYVSGHNLVVDGGFSVVNPTLTNLINMMMGKGIFDSFIFLASFLWSLRFKLRNWLQ